MTFISYIIYTQFKYVDIGKDMNINNVFILQKQHFDFLLLVYKNSKLKEELF